MSDYTVWDYINMITTSKEMPEFDANFKKNYSPFLVNRYFSVYGGPGTMFANEANKYYGMTKEHHFLMLHSLIRKGKYRKRAWPKSSASVKINFIMEVFNYSESKAKAVHDLITDEQIEELEAQRYKGGVTFKKQRKRSK